MRCACAHSDPTWPEWRRKMSDEARGLTKWQLALVVGVGAATVAGISLLAYVALRSGEDNAEDTETQQNRVESDPVGSPQLESGENDRGRAGISEAPNEVSKIIIIRKLSL